MAGLSSANKGVSVAETGAAAFAGLAAFAVMVIVFADVFLRYIFNAPLPWSYDLIGMYLVPALFFPILSDTFRRNHHIALDILYLRFPIAWQRAVRLLSAIVGVICFAVIAWLATIQTIATFSAGEVVGGSILWPTWVPVLIAALGYWLIVVRLVLDAVALAAVLFRDPHSPEVEGESPERGRSGHEVMEEI